MILLKKLPSDFFANNIAIRLENLALHSQLMKEMEKQRISELPKNSKILFSSIYELYYRKS